MEGEQALVEVGVHGRGLQPVGRGAELGRVRVLELARHLVRVRVRARVGVRIRARVRVRVRLGLGLGIDSSAGCALLISY